MCGDSPQALKRAYFERFDGTSGTSALPETDCELELLLSPKTPLRYIGCGRVLSFSRSCIGLFRCNECWNDAALRCI